jgi:hypothetical protein
MKMDAIDLHKGDSAYHLAMHLSYPSDADRDGAQRPGVGPGGDMRADRS